MSSTDKYIIRTSDRLAFKRCRRAWNWSSKLRENREPNKRARPLDFGTAVHAALEAYYDPRSWHDKEIKEGSAKAAFAFSMHEHRKDYLDLSGKMELDVLEQEEFDADMELGLGMLRGYFTWALKNDNFVPVHVEIEFEVPILDPHGAKLLMGIDCVPVVYQGRIDLIVMDEHGQYWLLDHKTTATFGNLEWLVYDEQCKSYAWAVEQMLGIKIAGVIYSQLRKKAPHKPAVLKSGRLSVNKQQDTSYEIFMETIKELNHMEEWYTDYLQHLQDEPKIFFRRELIRYNSHELKSMGEQIFDEAIEMLDNPRIYPTGGSNCNWCDFRTPCLAKNDGSDAQWILNDLFHVRGENIKNPNPAPAF